MAERNLNEGHRQRIRDKFSKHGLTSFHDYEALELLLTYVIPRRDVKTHAKRLLAHFGSLYKVFTASQSELTTIHGIGPKTAEFLSSLYPIYEYCMEDLLHEKLTGIRTAEYTSYLVNYFDVNPGRDTVALLFDVSGRMTCCELNLQQEKHEDLSREIILTAINHKTTSVVVARRHTSGQMDWTDSDHRLIDCLTESLQALKISFYDHVLVSGRETQNYIYDSKRFSGN